MAEPEDVMASPITRIITGSSSFTGAYFSDALCDYGPVVATFTKPQPDQDDRWFHRHSLLGRTGNIFDCAFMSENFIECLKTKGPIGLHIHGMPTDFGNDLALFNKTASDWISGIDRLFLLIKGGQINIKYVCLTGSYFQYTGFESDKTTLYSSFKNLVTDLFIRGCKNSQVPLGLFFITNPFGIYEQDRFVNNLARAIVHKQEFEIGRPSDVRDNIPIPLLTRQYLELSLQMLKHPCTRRFCPSFLNVSQIEFAKILIQKFSQFDLSLAHYEGVLIPNVGHNSETCSIYRGESKVQWDDPDDESQFWLNYFNFLRDSDNEIG